MAARVLVAGAAGQLGRAMTAARVDDAAGGRLRGGRLEFFGRTSSEMDITDPMSIRSVLRRLRPTVVVNCAAYTAVDAAETDEDTAYAINAVGAGALASACADIGAALVHVSTDYVFPGDGAVPGGGAFPGAGAAPGRQGYEPDDPVGPRTAYGRTKLAGERAVLAAHPEALVVRTSWVYTGVPRPDGSTGDFVATMRRLERERDHLDVVDDQRGSPTYAPDLAAGLSELVGRLVTGAVGLSGEGDVRGGGRVLHAAGAGDATWFELARAVFAEVGADPTRVRACRTVDMPRPARRPSYSVLSGRSWSAAGLTPLRHWRDALRAASSPPQV